MPVYKFTKKEKILLKNGFIVDGIAGCTAGLVATPFETIKKRLGTNQQWWFGWNKTMVQETFRGGAAFIFSVGPVTILQGAAVNIIKNNVNAGEKLSDRQKLVAAGSGGFASAFTENIILRQQKFKLGPAKAVASLFQQSLTRPWLGIYALFGREIIFGFSYMKAEEVEKNYGKFAVLWLGAAGSLASHPFDRIATENQHCETRQSIYQSALKILKEGGLRNMYKGGAARICLFTTSMVVISQIKNTLENETGQSRRPPCPG